MIRFRHIAPLLALIPMMACLKDDLKVEDLTGNPFDPAYEGPSVFVLDSTYTQVVNTGTSNVLFQVIAFRVRQELFLAPASYSVRCRDLLSGQEFLLDADPPGTHRFKVLRQPLPGQSVCLALALSNNLNDARTDTLCATL
jgi:hypothetical protein